jgi:hypothetical protein
MASAGWGRGDVGRDGVSSEGVEGCGRRSKRREAVEARACVAPRGRKSSLARVSSRLGLGRADWAAGRRAREMEKRERSRESNREGGMRPGWGGLRW